MHVDSDGPPDATPLVLLHGGTGTGRFHWSRQAEALARGWRLLMPDLPGHGRTPLPDDGRYDRALLVEAVEDLLRQVGPPVHVAGFSMGGHAALALASDRPELFASLVVVGVSVREHEGLRAWRQLFDPETLEATYPLWARQLSRLHEPLGGADAWRDVCRRDAGGLDVTVDLDALSRLQAPVLLVRGDRDGAVQPEQYAALRDVWGEPAEELVVPNGGHDVQLTRHELVRPALLDFLERARG